MPDVYLSRFRLHLVVRRHRLVFLFYYDFIVVRSFFMIIYLLFRNLCLTLQWKNN